VTTRVISSLSSAVRRRADWKFEPTKSDAPWKCSHGRANAGVHGVSLNMTELSVDGCVEPMTEPAGDPAVSFEELLLLPTCERLLWWGEGWLGGC
jgi:hypothetical protein